MLITKDYEGARLDRFTSTFLNLPHSLASRLIRKKAIKVNGKKAEISTRLKEGDEITLPPSIKLTPKETKRGEGFISEVQMQNFMQSIIYENDSFLIINKPSGLATQGGTNIKISVDEYLYHINQEYRLVHRLDKETSGILMIAKSRFSASKLAKDFETRSIKKTYIAIVKGTPQELEGVIDAKLAKQNFNDAGGVCFISEDGKESKTFYKVLEELNGYTKLEIKIETGRMHQIRVHLASIDLPIVGDAKYGETSSSLAKKIMPKMLLHAFWVEYNGEVFMANLPDYFIMQ